LDRTNVRLKPCLLSNESVCGVVEVAVMRRVLKFCVGKLGYVRAPPRREVDATEIGDASIGSNTKLTMSDDLSQFAY
jgi:hypothetical protein